MSDEINNRSENKGKLRHEEEEGEGEEKESDWENYSHDDEKTNKTN